MKSLKRIVDVRLLKKQTATIGFIGAGTPIRTARMRLALRGVWNLCHQILDDLEDSGECILEVQR